MKRVTKKTIKIAGLVLVTIFAVLVVFLIWLYSGSLNNNKIKAFTALPLPIAFVNGSAIYLPNYTLRWQTYEKLKQNKLTVQTPDDAKKTIFAQMVKDEALSQISAQRGIFVDKNELEAEYLNQASAVGSGTQNSLSRFLDEYGLNKNSYEKYIIKPQFLAIKLLVWFNSQDKLNSKQFALAQNLTSQIEGGQDMSTLAKQFSQEETGKIVGGDMGFVDPTELLLEMREPIYAMETGEIKIIPSRAGINIIKLEEKQSNKFHLRQIFLSPESFEAWLETQTKNFKTYKLINF